MNKTKTTTKLVAMTLACMLTCSPFFVASLPSSGAELLQSTPTREPILTMTDEYENNYNKLHFYFDVDNYRTIDSFSELNSATDYIKSLNSSSNNDLLSADSTQNSLENLSLVVQFSSDFTQTDFYCAMSENRHSLKTIEDKKSFRKQLNDYSKAYHANLITQKIDTVSELNYTSLQAIDYSPFVKLVMPIENFEMESLQNIIEQRDIVNISICGLTTSPPAYFDNETEVLSESDNILSWDDMLTNLNAYHIISEGTYTGEGINIGIYESGYPKRDHVNFTNIDLILRENTSDYRNHATQVLSIVTSIAPDASYFANKLSDDSGGVSGFSWFLDQYCDIVNCSFGVLNNYFDFDVQTGILDGPKQYDYSIDAIYDYYIETCFITIVCSSGNYSNKNTASGAYNPNNKVLSPGYAYNAITVGGIYWDTDGWKHDSRASYVDNDFPNVKPNISAPFTVEIPNIEEPKSGTSFSAPIVTGFVALLEESNSELCLAPDRILSILTATAQKTADYTTNVGFFDDSVGAGVADLAKMIEIGNSSTSYVMNANRTVAAGNSTVLKSIYLESGQTVQAALTWLAQTNGVSNSNGITVTEIYVTDYDMFLIDSTGNILAGSNLIESNEEMIRYTAEQSGTYRIAFYQAESLNSNITVDYLYLTYCLE